MLGLGIKHIWFNDEIFYDHSRTGMLWLESFILKVRNSRFSFTFNIELRPNDIVNSEIEALKDIGLTTVFTGIESGIQRILNEMRKDTTVDINNKALEILRNNAIRTEMGWISFVPTMTYEELLENYEYLFKCACYTEENIYNKFNLYSGSYYEQILGRQNLLLARKKFYDRFAYLYIDAKVESFVRAVDLVRSEFECISNSLRPLQERISITAEYHDYLAIRSAQRTIWHDFICELIKHDEVLRFSNNAFTDSDVFQATKEQILKLNDKIRILTGNNAINEVRK
jgi:radical SAM superfamily enzyme YgiQ (UPF0313 family)